MNLLLLVGLFVGEVRGESSSPRPWLEAWPATRVTFVVGGKMIHLRVMSPTALRFSRPYLNKIEGVTISGS